MPRVRQYEEVFARCYRATHTGLSNPCQEWRNSGRQKHLAALTGTIKRLVSDKGFGFILASDGVEYFFHNSACSGVAFDELREAQAVTFDVGQGPKGPRGENVRLA
jgi:CspA family cold shock protein